MRGFGVLCGYLLLAGLLGALCSYPLWLLLGEPLDLSFDKTLSRAVLLAAIVLLPSVIRRLSLTRDELGYTPFSGAQVARHYALAIALILPPLLFFVGIRFRVLDPRVGAELLEVLRVGLAGLIGGVLVGLIEETIFRGAMLGVVKRTVGVIGAAVLSSLVYASVHFIEAPVLQDTPHFFSGFLQLFASFSFVLSPAQHWDSFVSLFLLGMALCGLRLWTGSLWPCIAMHAAWVFALRVYKDLTVRDVEHAQAWLVGSYDNFNGLFTAGYLLLALIIGWLLARRTARRAQPVAGALD